MQIRTYDPKLIRRLTALSEEYPNLCKCTGKDEICDSYFEVEKKRIRIHVTRPYSMETKRRPHFIIAETNKDDVKKIR